MAQAAQKQPPAQSLAQQKVASMISQAQKSESLWNGALVFLATVMLLSTINFFPIYIIIPLALVCGAISSKAPPYGIIIAAVLGLPGVMYQSSVFAWFYILLLVLILFEVFEYWMMVAVLEVLILAPFAFGGLPFSGYVTIVGMAMGALYFGSKKSLSISLFAVSMILLLSSVWLVQNTAYMPIKNALYTPAKPELQFSKKAVDIGGIGGEIAGAIGRFFDLNNLTRIWESVGFVADNFIRLLVGDSLILQLIGWGIALFLVGYLPTKLKPRPQLMSALALLILIPVYFLVNIIYGVGFRIEFPVGIVIAIAVLGGLEQIGLNISRESEIGRAEKMKAYGKFGMTDMSAGGEEKSMADVGGYEDVKSELRDAIIMPLEKKEIAFTYGIKPPAGILLFGPPGTGKTMLMRALAKELKYNFIEVKCSQILSQWYGESLPYDEKLVIKDTDGRIARMEIGKIVEEKRAVKVLSFDKTGRAVFAKIKDWIKHKTGSPVYEVRTRTGRRIKVTDYHSLFAFDGMKLDSVPTSKLKAKSSYIAIPKKIGFSAQPLTQIDFLGSLKEDDFGLYVKNPSAYLSKAIMKLGIGRVSALLGYKRQRYLEQVMRDEVGVRVSPFMKVMGEASVEVNGEDIRIGAGSKTIPGVISIDERLSTFIGLWVAEGSYNRMDTLRISTSEKELGGIEALCRELFGNITVYRKRESKGRDIYIASRPLYVLFRRVLGLEDGAGKKKMPDIAFNIDRKNLAALLRGYFSGDGTIYENQRGVAMVEGSTASRELADQLLHLLLYFGIVATVYDKKEWSGTNSFRVYMCGGKLLSRFREIGFLDSSKMERLDKSISRVGWFRDEQIPLTGKLRDFVSANMPKWADSATIGRTHLGNMEDLEEVARAEIENDIYLDRVESITKVGEEKYVYDVSVDPCQNFVAGFGGIFAHNSEKNVAEVFDNARKNAPTVLFFDEIDAVGKKRSAESLDEVGQRVLSELLQQIDGASKSKNTVMVVGATNRPDSIDSAMLRPGRLDKIIYMHLPDPEARKAILKVNLRGLPLANDIDLDVLAKKTERFSGADMKNVATEAKRLAAKEATTKGVVVPLSMSHFLQVLSYVKPSTSLALLDMYEQFRLDFERRVGAAKPKEEEAAKEAAVKWSDVAGMDQVKQALLEAIELPLLHEAEMKDMQVKPSKGILLFGPPGTGKTLIVKAAATELKASFQALSAAEVMKKGYTQAVTVIKEAFNRARENPPGIIFVDEIETFAPARGAGGSSEILGQFLTEMDGVKGKAGVVVMAATNKPALMDPAIMRPGRFDKIFYIPPPDEKGREDMFKIHLGKFAGSVDLRILAEMTPGFSGADIADICQNAKMRALRAKLAGAPEAVSTQTIVEIIRTRRPSITAQILDEYRKFLEAYGERR